MPRSVLVVLVLELSSSTVAFGQTTGAGYADALSPSLANVAKAMHATIRRDLAEAAEGMPAEEYGFQPTPQVRTFGQLVGHVINANLFFCSQAGGEKVSAMVNYEQIASKPALVKALNDSLALCDVRTGRRRMPTSTSRSTLPLVSGWGRPKQSVAPF